MTEKHQVTTRPSAGEAGCCCGSGERSGGCSGEGNEPIQLAGAPPRPPRVFDLPWMEGRVSSPAGEIPRARTRLLRADRLGAWRVRLGFGRTSYRVEPGLYAVGGPSAASPVLVTANYKLSFDRLRSRLAGLDAWILVLDTRGINVWCAAGKGTFGTAEVVRRVNSEQLARVVSHRRLILPQLGAPGVAAHQVQEATGFKVRYGPIRAEDLPAYLAAGGRATPEMRRVRFPLAERLSLAPVEVVGGWRRLAVAAAVLTVLAGLGRGGYSVDRAAAEGPAAAGILLLGYLAGNVLVPALLPWLPGRAFALKGAVLGLGLATVLALLDRLGPGLPANPPTAAGWALLLTAVVSFLGMNFTGSSTYTSLSGVMREMRVAVPLQIGAAAIGLGLWVAGRFA